MRTPNKLVSLLSVGLLAGPMAANAALIDQGGYTTDTSNGLDWLDLSATTGLSVVSAVAAYSPAGYRYANNQEVGALLAEFGIPYNFVPGSVVELFPNAGSATNFLSLMGTTFSSASLGGFELLGGGRSVYLCISINGCGPESFVNDADLSGGGDSIVGVFLVRDTTSSPVPLPAAAWLLLSGLGGLGFVARRRKAL